MLRDFNEGRLSCEDLLDSPVFTKQDAIDTLRKKMKDEGNRNATLWFSYLDFGFITEEVERL